MIVIFVAHVIVVIEDSRQSCVLGLGTWTRTAIVNELERIWVDSDILDAEIFQSTVESMSCVI